MDLPIPFLEHMTLDVLKHMEYNEDNLFGIKGEQFYYLLLNYEKDLQNNSCSFKIEMVQMSGQFSRVLAL